MRFGACLAILSAALVPACGCGETGTHGQADAEDAAPDPWVVDGPCTGCDDGNPCTMDLCNLETDQCAVLPLDLDGDLHISIIGTDGTTFCGGDDCDDTRADVYPGAPEVCLDGVDQDCDTVVDGPVVMGSEVRVTETDEASIDARIVWTGDEYALVWVEDSNGFVYPTLEMARLDALGTILSRSTLDDHCDGWPSPRLPAVAWSGSRLGLCWRGCFGILFAQVGLDGVEDGSTSLFPGSETCGIAWTGSEYGLASVYYDSMSLAAVNATGDVTWPASTVAAPDTGRFDDDALGLAWTGSRLAVAWVEAESSWGNWDIWLATAAPGSAEPLEPVQVTDGTFTLWPDLVWTGSEIGMAFEYPVPSVYFERLGPAGEVLGPPVRVSDTGFHASRPRVSWTGSTLGIAWMAGQDTSSAPAFRLVTPEGEPLGDAITISEARGCLHLPDLAWSGSEFGVAWKDSRHGEVDRCDSYSFSSDDNWEIYFARVGMCE